MESAGRLVESTVKLVESARGWWSPLLNQWSSFSVWWSLHIPTDSPKLHQPPNRLHQSPTQTAPTSTNVPNRLPLDPPNRLHQLHLRLHQAPPQTPPTSTSDSTNLHQFDTYLSDNCTTYQQVSCAPPSWRIHIFLLHQIGGAFRLLLVPRGVLLGVGRGY